MESLDAPLEAEKQLIIAEVRRFVDHEVDRRTVCEEVGSNLYP